MTEKHIQTAGGYRPIVGAQNLKLWAGKGSGARCTQCGHAIAAADIEYEVEPDSRGVLIFHVRCFDAWRASYVSANARHECP